MTHDPSDDYLWDRSGEPDEELRRLELLLAGYRYQPGASLFVGLARESPPEDEAD